MLGLLMLSCNEIGQKKTFPESEEIKIKINPRNFSDSEFFLSDIADDIIYIPLDDSILIGSDHFSFKVINHKIYLGGEGNLVYFNMEGKNPKQIGNIGKGPGEYLYCSYFAVDENGNIYVLGKRNAILVYSPNGRFIKEIKLPAGSFFQDIDFLGSSLFLAEYIHGGHSPNRWLIIDTTGIVLSQKHNFLPPSTSGRGPAGGIYKYRNEISYWDNKIDTVYSIKTDFTYKPSLVVPPGNHRLPFDGIPFNISPREYIEKHREFFLLGDIIETNKYYFLNYQYERKMNIALINKDNGEIRRGRMAASLSTADAHKWGISNDI
ncbi:MAG: 6-bladed beta-propeller, partial [Bacteroidales bacterium]